MEQKIHYQRVDTTGTVIYIAVDGKYAGHILVSDKIKDDSKKTIRALKALGVKTIAMLTGDTKEVGEQVGQELGLDKVYTHLLPQHKVEKLEMLEKDKKSKGKLICKGWN